jgi:intracellular multiplication protein IcmB
MSAYFGRPGHALQIWFCRDPDLSASMLKSMMVSPRTVAKRLNLDLDDLFAERERNLPRFIVHEAFYMVLWTRMSVLSSRELQKVRQQSKPPPLWPPARDSQDLFRAGRQVTVRHNAFVTSFLADLRAFGIRADALEGHEALKAVKASIYPDMTLADWRAHLPGEIYTTGKGTGGPARERAQWARSQELPAGDMSHLLWPRIEDQLFDRDAEVLNPHVVRIGRYFFSGADMSVGPQDLLPFSELLQRMMEVEEIPWRMSMLVEGDGLSSFGMKSLIAALAGWSNSENRQIREAIKALAAHKADGGVVVRMRASFATWAPSDNLGLIEDRANRLQRAVESWGYCHVSPSAGDPLAGALSSALGLDVRSTAPAGAPPLEDVIYMLPWNRDSSPFRTGSVLFRTIDGRPWPFQPGSSQQDTFIDIIYAPPGKGKSVWLNTTNLAFCLSAMATSGTGGAQLPRIAIIDIGPSSSGLISLIKEALPASRRHEAEYRRLRMIKEHAINPFDTQLGCRKPLPLERSFLVNFISLLGTPVGQESPPANLSDLAGMAVDELYEQFSDRSKKGNPRPYTPGEDLAVDEAMRRYDIGLSEFPTWWECVDRLFGRGARHEAALAQRHAVPRVEDLMVIRTPQIKDVFGKAMANDNQTLIDLFQMMVSASLREYPILTQPTKFDLGESRVVSLDLDEAAPRGGGPSDKQTAIVYMLARFVIAKDFYLNEDILPLMPEDYQKHHEARIRRIRETPKRLIFDEFHRTKSTPIIREQVKIDMREGRKWGVQVGLASQLLDDFDDDMISLATSYWIMGVNADKDAHKAAKMFGLSDSATSVILNDLRGPGPGGAPFLAVLQLKDGKHEHLLVNTLGPTEIWAFSTTSEDVGLRKRLYSAIGAVEARKRLAKRFPGGSAKSEIERRVVERADRGETSSEASEGVIEELARELLARGAPAS